MNRYRFVHRLRGHRVTTVGVDLFTNRYQACSCGACWKTVSVAGDTTYFPPEAEEAGLNAAR